MTGRLVAVADTEPMPRLSRHVALGLAGILYYVGLILKTLVADGKYQPVAPKIFIGGNGSRLLDWAGSSEFSKTSGLMPLFRTMLLQSSGLPEIGFDLRRTTEPKAEAACGLVVDSPFGTAQAGGASGGDAVIAGEEVTVGSVVRSRLTIADFKNKIILGSMPNLTRFVELYNNYARSRLSIVLPIDDEVEVLRRTKESVQDRLLGQSTLAEDEIELEPVFITGLRAMIQKVLDPR